MKNILNKIFNMASKFQKQMRKNQIKVKENKIIKFLVIHKKMDLERNN